ncbi:MAG: ribosome-associated translation inhibitor RaiA [Deltaproteobacteria bacterium]|nr:ribosome-associated translation inhibitor RaiA [Deltaproteobacteria bacterium]
MQIDITFRNLESSQTLRGYVIKRLSKIDKYIDRLGEAHVVLSVEKIRHKAEVTLNADGMMINAVEITEDMYSAIDMVMDKLERQVKRYKEKSQMKKGSGSRGHIAEQPPLEEMEKKPRIIHEEDYFVKPMSVDEAVGQMDFSDNDFIIFHNTETNNINLLYKRDDGGLGLIETGK